MKLQVEFLTILRLLPQYRPNVNWLQNNSTILYIAKRFNIKLQTCVSTIVTYLDTKSYYFLPSPHVTPNSHLDDDFDLDALENNYFLYTESLKSPITII